MIVRFMNQFWLVTATQDGGLTLVGVSAEEARRLSAMWREIAIAECDA